MARFKNTNWNLNAVGNGKIETWQQAEIAVLMDIRDELQALNKTLSCYRVVEMADAVLAQWQRLYDEVRADRDKAVRTLQQAGYTDCGGELWKPPLGKRPDFEQIDRLRAVAERAQELVRSVVIGSADPDTEIVREPALTHLEAALAAAGYDLTEEEMAEKLS